MLPCSDLFLLGYDGILRRIKLGNNIKPTEYHALSLQQWHSSVTCMCYNAERNLLAVTGGNEEEGRQQGSMSLWRVLDSPPFTELLYSSVSDTQDQGSRSNSLSNILKSIRFKLPKKGNKSIIHKVCQLSCVHFTANLSSRYLSHLKANLWLLLIFQAIFLFGVPSLFRERTLFLQKDYLVRMKVNTVHSMISY